MDAQLATLMIHSDDELRLSSAVAPEMSLSTTFKHPRPHEDGTNGSSDPIESKYIYSRYAQPTLARAEKLLSSLLGGPAMLYSSGLGAAMAALMYLKPKTLAITDGYHGVHEVIAVYKTFVPELVLIHMDDDYPENTVAWIETPLNPKGEARNMQHYADKVHAVGGKLIVDATFAPPPLMNPFKHGADVIMHSATKYFFGHSDALGGVLAVREQEEWEKLWHLRTFGGAVPGSMEVWLLLRSLRTLTIRVQRQAQTATQLALWLNQVASKSDLKGYDGCPPGVLKTVHHARLQAMAGGFDAFAGPNSQLLDGPACFSFVFENETHAKWFPFELKYFVAATSLGGVESLVEQRRVSDPHEDPCLVRVSIGLEELEDLKSDIRQALIAVSRRK